MIEETERVPFTLPGFSGEAAPSFAGADLAREIPRLTDPGEASETLHWGRNYLYVTRLQPAPGAEPVEVVVKQFRNETPRARLDRRLRGSKARRSWEKAHRLRELGFSTPEPLVWIESEAPGGPSFFVTRRLSGVMELRYLLRGANQGLDDETLAARFPQLPLDETLGAVGALVRRLHEARVWYRDMTSGNVLLERADGELRLWLVDVNRARFDRRLTLLERTRDLSRMPIFRPEDQDRFVGAYWGEASADGAKRFLYRLYHRAFYGRTRWKTRLRTWRARLAGKVVARSTHAHIPKPPPGAKLADRVVWDHLSDQPHIHAGPLTKLGVRMKDAPSHLAELASLGRAAPRILHRYRKLRAALGTPRRVPFEGIGVALRPPAPGGSLEELLAAVDDCRVRHVLVRLHPWEPEGHDAEEELVRQLAARGLEISFALPQNRELVRQPERWRGAVEEIARRFTPYGRAFQVGQAINRSKWGVWTVGEYVGLVEVAGEALRAARADVEILGPAVIDFELHRTASILNLRSLARRGVAFDAVASLLYVDRRGAPENPQMGLDTVGKVTLLRAIAETARNTRSSRSWITEVNWPLWEGPHSPAGKAVSVDERAQADYLVRYYLLALGTGYVERVFWWQLVARGYGLAYLDDAGRLVRRPAFRALRTLVSEASGTTFLGPVPDQPEGTWLYRFERPDGGETVAAWTTVAGGATVELAGEIERVVGTDGEEETVPPDGALRLGSGVRWVRLAR